VSGSWRVAAIATFALIVLEFAWSRAAGPFPIRWWVIAGGMSLPLLAPAVLFALRRPRAPLWAGIVALIYFCQGVVGVRTDFGPWPWLAIALSLVIIFAAGWPGIAAKIAKRRAAPPPNV
jgi:uncharacterized membrane protein